MNNRACHLPTRFPACLFLLSAFFMNLIALLIPFAVLASCASASAQEPMTVTGPAYKMEGGKNIPISKEEAVCGLLRQQAVETTAVCAPRYAKQVGLTLVQCATLTKAATAACDAYSQSFIQPPLSLAQCMKASDRHQKCTLVISSGCEYTKALAQKLESIEGTRDVESITNAIKSECPLPNVGVMAAKAREGKLWVTATWNPSNE